MRILLSNDDGIHAPGLEVLEQIATSISDAVTIVAPDSNMSGAGHSLTLNTPLRLTDHGSNHYSVNGTPTDCVVMAVRHVMQEKPDLVLSGVNFDSNLAEDVTYSGTVAVAMEATLLGIPAIAFSQKIDKNGTINWDIAKTYASMLIKLLMNRFDSLPQIFLNVNFPSGSVDDVKGVLVTKQGNRTIDDHVIRSVDPRGKPYFWIGAADYRKNETHEDLGTDLGAVHNGYVSVTPLSLGMTAVSSLNSLNEILTC